MIKPCKFCDVRTFPHKRMLLLAPQGHPYGKKPTPGEMLYVCLKCFEEKKWQWNTIKQ